MVIVRFHAIGLLVSAWGWVFCLKQMHKARTLVFPACKIDIKQVSLGYAAIIQGNRKIFPGSCVFGNQIRYTSTSGKRRKANVYI